jgi:hypothetical protein
MEDYWNIFGHEITDSDYAQELCLENSADELPQAAFLCFPQLLEKSTASYCHSKCPFLTNKPYLPLDRDRNYPRPIPRDSSQSSLPRKCREREKDGEFRLGLTNEKNASSKDPDPSACPTLTRNFNTSFL